MQLSGGPYPASAALLPVRLTQIDGWMELYRALSISCPHPALLISQGIAHLEAQCSVYFLKGPKLFVEEPGKTTCS